MPGSEREFFEALIVKDYEKGGLIYSGIPAEKIRAGHGRLNVLRILEIGNPTAGLHPDLTQADLNTAWDYYPMAGRYADEDFSYPTVVELPRLGHDILTAQEAGEGGQRRTDEEVLAFAVVQDRAVVTFNRRHFIRLDRRVGSHSGIFLVLARMCVPLAPPVPNLL